LKEGSLGKKFLKGGANKALRVILLERTQRLKGRGSPASGKVLCVLGFCVWVRVCVCGGLGGDTRAAESETEGAVWTGGVEALLCS